MNAHLFTTRIVTQLAAQPIIRVRIHKDKYIPCKLVRCHFSDDWEDKEKDRQYIYIQNNEVILDAWPGLSVEPDNTIALRGRSSVHPDDWDALRRHWLAIPKQHWILLDPDTPALEQPATFAVDLKSEEVVEQVKELAERVVSANYGLGTPNYGEAAEYFIRGYEPPRAEDDDDDDDDYDGDDY